MEPRVFQTKLPSTRSQEKSFRPSGSNKAFIKKVLFNYNISQYLLYLISKEYSRKNFPCRVNLERDLSRGWEFGRLGF